MVGGTAFYLVTIDPKIPEQFSSPCPLCDKTWKVLVSTLENKERNGRDTLHYLAKKTLEKNVRSELSKKSRCSKCHKLFLRLDTHLGSKGCGQVRLLPKCSYVPPESALKI